MASGEVISLFADDPTHPDMAVLVPPENATNVPISGHDLTSIGLAVANQKPSSEPNKGTQSSQLFKCHI